uniref:Zona pellucida sperm-binding protein 2 n=1 Tax=Magallana gigas TaxID=29159 RepID=K1QWR7_MAGGI
MTWLDPNCSIAFNGTHFISKILHDQCGTTVGLSQSNVIFENKIIVHPFKTENSVLDFGTAPTEISVKCIYPRAEMTMSSYQPVKQQVRLYEKRFGHLDIDMRQFETNQFKHALNDFSTPRKLELSSDIFISVGLPTGDTSGLGVHLDTKSASKWLRNLARLSNELDCFGLPFRCSKVNFVHFLPSPANEARFSLKTFQFTSSQSNVVYIHCQAVVCLANSSQCSTDCSPSRRTKRDVSSDTSHLLSMGPLMFVTKRERELHIIPDPQKASSNVVANIIAGVSATVAMVAVVYAALSRRRINSLQFKDNDKTNF